MSSLDLLKKRGNRIIITLLIILICSAVTIYYLTLPQDSALNFYFFRIESDKARYVIVILSNFLGLIAGIFANIVATDVHETIKEDESDEVKPPQVIVPPIEIRNIISNTPETKQPEIVTPPDSKFYPISFIPDLKFFVGRELLMKNLEKKLKMRHRASIHDISGLGKTFSTYKFAEKHQERYKRIFFVRANRETMLQSLAEIGVWLNPLLESEPDQSKKASGFKRWLEENDKWLVIYDNVDVPSELKPYVPANPRGDCLFSSNFSSIENLAEGVSINKLSKPEARQLLYSRANNNPQLKPRLDDEEQIAFEKIIEEVDGHPLSLNTTGAFISKNNLSFAEYQRKLDRTPNILLENDDEFDDYHRKSALKAFSVAIDDICQPKSSDKFTNSAILAEKLLFAVSFIAPDDIPETLLKRILFNIAGIDFETTQDEDLWLEIRRKLPEYDLVKYDKYAKSFTTHRLIQKVIQTRLNEQEKTSICNAALNTIDRLFPYSKHETKKECEIYFPHAVALIKKAEIIDISSEQTAAIHSRIGTHLREIVKYEQAIEFFEKTVNIYRNLPEYSEDLAFALNELGIIYQLQGKYDEAIKKFEEALLIGEKTIGKEHRDYAIRLNNLAVVYRLQGRYNEAIEKYEEVLRIDEKTIGKEHLEYATHLNNLGLVYRFQNRYDEAIEKFGEALRISEKTVGKEHPDYAAVLNNLGLVYQSQNKFDEAIEKLKEALQIDEKTIGKEHPDYAIDLNNLANVYYSQDKIKEAISLFQETLKILTNTLPKNHPYIEGVKESIKNCEEKLR